ncbi:Beta-ketoacyl synthase [Apiospora phragmitis]|uniref:Beta-ketoacyl synthase n=1 Tax=Apiospora phragmitis TaxID=2905665 RepID=A0ABR1TW40_9PEZI
MSLILKYALISQSDLNIQAEVGTKMLAFMWIAVGFMFVSFVIHSAIDYSRLNGRTGGIANQSTEAQAAAIRAAYLNAGISNLNDTQYL